MAPDTQDETQKNRRLEETSLQALPCCWGELQRRPVPATGSRRERDSGFDAFVYRPAMTGDRPLHVRAPYPGCSHSPTWVIGLSEQTTTNGALMEPRGCN